jgi:hypothetical protein
MRRSFVLLLVLAASLCRAQQVDSAAAPAAAPEADPARTDFHVKYVSGTNVYIDGGTSSGLAEGTELILKQNTSLSDQDAAKTNIEPGIVARLKVISVASTSAVCEVVKSSRDLAEGDQVSLPDAEVKKIIDKDAVGSTRHYPMVISFTDGDPMDEEVRDEVPRPPLPEVNEMRGRFGFDMSNIQSLGQGGSSTSEYGMVVRADFTRLFGSHWNLNGYWRGTFQHDPAGLQSIQDVMNRTYLMSLSYINPDSMWSASIGRMYLPYASSLETIDGVYVGMRLTSNGTLGMFAGSTPDPTAWNYNPQRRIGGGFFNWHGGDFETMHYSSTVGAGVELLKWSVDRPFLFTENDFSFKKIFSIYHSMQIDRPTANPGMPAIGAGIGQSLLSLRVQVHPRVALDITDTYFRDVPTYDPVLVGTGLLDKFLYQGLNGGVRVQFPLHLAGYVSLGESNDSSDKKNSLNELFGLSVSRIGKTGFGADVRYSKFDSAFASGTYRTLSITRELGERFRLDLMGGRYDYNSSLAATSNSYFINTLFDVDLGAKMFVQSAFTTQRGGTTNYNQFTTTLGYRFDNRQSMRKAVAPTSKPQPEAQPEPPAQPEPQALPERQAQPQP